MAESQSLQRQGEHNVVKPSAGALAGLLAEVQNMSIPPVQCSFTCSNHPDAAHLKEASDAWIVARFGHLPSVRGSFTAESLIHSGFDLLTTLTYANGLPSRMMPILKYIAWLFMFDTILDDPLLVGAHPSAANALFSAISSVLDNPSFQYCGQDPLIRVITDTAREWWLEVRLGMSPMLQARFVASSNDYLEASRRQIQYRASSCLPELNTFLRIRADAGCWQTCALLIEYALQIDFDEETVANPLFAALNAVAASHIYWVNDLLSFKKEVLEGDLLNLVAVLYACKQGKEEEVRLEGVVEEVCGMIKKCDEECVRVLAEMKASQVLMGKAGMAGYLDGVGNWLSGSLCWHMVSGRYGVRTPVPPPI